MAPSSKGVHDFRFDLLHTITIMGAWDTSPQQDWKMGYFLINLIMEGDYFSFLDWYSYYKGENFEQLDSTSPKHSFSYFY